VELTANPASGYSLLGWTSGGASLGASATLTFALTQDTVITVNFGKLGTYNITAAGTLKDVSDIKTISHLTLTGSIDARDVQLMRDSMTFLTELDLSGATVVAYSGTGGTYPWGHNSYPANEMPQYSFYNSSTGKTSLISVKLPTSLTSIGSQAFYNCSGLSGSLTFPAGLTSIGSQAFYNCSDLSGLTLPAGLTSIGSDAFQNCNGLSGSLTLPTGLTSIGDNAFSNCSGLKELTLPAGLTSIGYSAFSNCSGLKELTLPAGLTSINDNAFSNCSGLKELTLPAGLTSIGSSAFQSCSGLSSLTFPAGLTSIGSYAFSNCSNLGSVTNLSLTPQSISSYVFYNVSIAAITLTVPTSAVALYESAEVWKDFNGNNITGGGALLSAKPNNGALGSVSGTLSGLHPVGATVTLIAVPASGYSLLSWTSGGATLGTGATLTFTLTQDTAITANFSKQGRYDLIAGTLRDVSGIETVTHLTLTGTINARDVKLMRDNMPFLTELDLSGATVVAYSGEGGTSPYSSSYPANEMPQYSFYNNQGGGAKTSLTSVKLPASLTSIGNYAFYNCSGLSGSLTLPAGLTSIGSDAFANCSGLSGSLTLPAGLTTIGSFAFSGCSGLKELTLPAGLTSISDNAFSNCSGLSGSLTLPAGLTSISDYAFYNCSGLSGSLTLPTGLTSIGSQAFSNCSGLSGKLTFPAGLTTINSQAFYNCSGLSNLTLPTGLTTIGSYAFENCSGLTSVINLRLTPQSVSSNVFYGVAIENVALTVPGSSVSLYESANVWRDFSPITGNGVLLSVKPSYAALGSVSGALLSGLHPAGTPITLTAAPALGCSFLSWTSGDAILSTSATLTLTLTRDTVITANFWKSVSYKVAEAGALKDVSGIEQVTHLKLTGAIDARDVKLMRDNMPCLTELDLSEAIVVAYEGAEGTYPYSSSYPANEMPLYSFYNNPGGGAKTSLTSVKLPAGLTSIGEQAFYNCSGLNSLTLPTGLTSIGYSAFYNCSGLSGNLTLPAGLTSIGDNAFSNCSELSSLTLPTGLTSIGYSAFSNCSGLSGNLTFPAGLTYISYYAFENCSGLSSLTLPAGLTSIGELAFSGCSGLDSVTNLRLTPQYIYSGMSVFNGVEVGNVALIVPTSSVDLYKNAEVWRDFNSNGNGVTDGGVLLSVKPNYSALGSVSGAVSGLYPAGSSVMLTAAAASSDCSFLSWTSGSTTLSTSATLTVTLARDTVITANFWKSGSYNLAEAGALKDVSGIETVTHLTLTGSIDARDVKFMRDNMTFLTELDLSEAIVVAYEGEEGTYPYGYNSYPANAMPQYSFYWNGAKTSLTSVKLPAGLASIGSDAFYNCSGLKELNLPTGLTSIGSYAFSNCSGLSGNLTLPAGLTTIGYSAFYNCSSLSGSLILPVGLTTIGSSAFSNCSGLSGSLTLPAGLTSISNYAFAGCSGLSSSLILPTGLTSIGSEAFFNCSGLSGSLTLPAGLTSISDLAFSGCSGLDSVTNLSLTPQDISYRDVFYNVTIGNVALIVPDSSVSAYKNALVWRDFNSNGNGITGGGVLLSVKSNNSALGSVSGARLSGLYPAGTAVSVTAAPASGYSFLGWTSGGASLGASNSLSFALTQDTVITASFGKSGSYILAEAGTLKDMDGIKAVTHLTLTGAIDARDVQLMRDSMPFLTELDLSGATVVAYEGEEGTYPYSVAYPANEMPQYSFYWNSAKTSLTSVKLPTGLTSIGSQAFSNCSGLSGGLTFPAGLTSIGSQAFFNCSGLSGLTLPAGLTSIGSYAFYNCSGLTSVTNLSLTPQSISSDVFYNVSVSSVALRVSAASLAAYQNAQVWRDFYVIGGATLRVRVNNSEWGAVAGSAGWLATGATVSLAATPAQGYEFGSWTSGGATLGATASLSLTLTRDTVITANFKPTGNVAVYTVSFNANGGSSVEPIAVASGGRIAKPADPTRSGYTFAGWYRNEATTGSAWSFASSTVTASITLYAKWTEITCTVTFETNGGSSVEPLTVALGAHIAKPVNPTRTGHTFDGWYSNEWLSGSEWNFAGSAVSANITLYAKWDPIIYIVSFSVEGESSVKQQQIAYGGAIAKPADPTRTGYIFAGWYRDAAFASTWDFASDVVAATTTLYAGWIAQGAATCTVTFNANGGSEVSPQIVEANGRVAQVTPPTRTGYTFDGWYGDPAFTGAWSFTGNVVTANTTLYAKWTLNTYTVTFDAGDSSSSSVSPQQVAHGGKIVEPADPIRSGYILAGWYRDAVLTSVWNFAGDAVTDNITLYAKWIAESVTTYTVTFVSNGGSEVSPQKVAKNGRVAPFASPTRIGYTFAGWYSNAALTGSAWSFAGSAVTADITLYAKWTRIVYTVTFNANGGSGSVSSQQVAQGDAVALPDPAPTRTGYNFVGWYKDAAFASVWNFAGDVATANITLYARWVDESVPLYTVTFETGDGSSVSSQKVVKNEKVAQVTPPTLVGYTFGGWYKEATSANVWSFASDTVTADITLYAKWTEIFYTVTFETGDGSSVSPLRVAHGSKIDKPADDPTRTGHAFAGWYKDMTLTGAWSFADDAVTDNTTLYARWIVTYTVTFDANGGSTVNSQTVVHDGKIVKPADPTRTGYTFGGWYSDAATTGSTWNFASDAVTDNMTLYAKWNALPPTGVESHTLGVVKVYPNPTSGMVTVESDGAEVLLYSLSGVLLKRASGNRINLSGYPAGVYVLRAGNKAARIVKQ
jgi:uncharacterized repeat protein (TIGR02543 family)